MQGKKPQRWWQRSGVGEEIKGRLKGGRTGGLGSQRQSFISHSDLGRAQSPTPVGDVEVGGQGELPRWVGLESPQKQPLSIFVSEWTGLVEVRRSTFTMGVTISQAEHPELCKRGEIKLSTSEQPSEHASISQLRAFYHNTQNKTEPLTSHTR